MPRINKEALLSVGVLMYVVAGVLFAIFLS